MIFKLIFTVILFALFAIGAPIAIVWRVLATFRSVAAENIGMLRKEINFIWRKK